jgi:hypothetical protein
MKLCAVGSCDIAAADALSKTNAGSEVPIQMLHDEL